MEKKVTPDLEIPSFLKRRKTDRDDKPDPVVKKIVDKLYELESDDIEAVKEDAPTGDIVDMKSAIKANALSHTAELDEEIDKFTSADFKSDFVPYEWFSKNEIKGVHAVEIKNFYEPLVEELQGALKGDDEQLKEAYAYLNKRQLLKYVTFVNEILIAADRWYENSKRNRKPRKPKVRKAVDLVRKVTYCKEHLPLQLVSLLPEKIVGAHDAWVFDVVYNKLTHYVAKAAHDLTIKGSTIQNFDEALSLTKRLRKPEKVIAQLAGSKVCQMIFNDLKTKPYPATGRLNKNVLILKVF